MEPTKKYTSKAHWAGYIALVLVVTVIALSNGHPRAAVCSPKKIVVLGSSTAAGTGANPATQSWANRYSAYLVNANAGNSLINLAVPGYTTYDILPTGSPAVQDRPAPDPSHNITAAFANNPNAIIVNMPTNDAANGYTIAEQQTNYQSLANAAQAAGIPIWFTTTQPRNASDTVLTNLMTMRDWITSTYGTYALDFWTTVANADGTINDTYSYGDGIHLNNQGHDVLYNRVLTRDILAELCASTANVAPTVNAGADQAITLPTNSVTLTGTATDSDGSVASYAWSEVSGGAATITTPTSATTTVTGLVQGVYTFRLTATDDQGASTSDDVIITVNPQAQPTTRKYLLDFGSTNTTATGWNNITGTAIGGTIALKDSTNAASGISIQVTDAFLGINTGGTTASTLYPSTATSDSFFVGSLNGATDNQGIIRLSGLNNSAQYKLRFYGSRTASDTAARIAVYTVAGQSYQLQATNNVNNYIDSASLTPTNGALDITVTKTSTSGYGYLGVLEITETSGSGVIQNNPPTANAGIDQTITLPTSSVTLAGTGTDTDGTIASYTWSKVSGGAATITNAASQNTSVTGLAQGSYTFRLTVTDNAGATATDDMLVTVNGAANVPPTVSLTTPANNATFTAPASITISASASDSDGTISKVEFYNGTTLLGTAAVAPYTFSWTNVAAGTYTLSAKATDNSGATTTSSTISVTVNVQSGSSIRKFLLDFGSTNTTATGWNTISNPAVGSAVALKDGTGAATTVTEQVTDAFLSINTGGTTSSTLYPSTATSDSFFIGSLNGATDNQATVRIAGLNSNYHYTFRFYGSRVASDTANRTTIYSIGANQYQLQTTNNVNNYIEATNVVPVGGIVDIQITKPTASTYGYLGVLEINEFAN